MSQSDFYYFLDTPSAQYTQDEIRQFFDTQSLPQNLNALNNVELQAFGIQHAYQPQSGQTHYLDADGIWKHRDKTADEIKAELLPFLANYRWQVETGGIEVNNMPVHTDRDAQSKLTAARTIAKENPNYSVRWKTADGSFHVLDADTIIAVADAVRGHVEAAFAAEADTEAEIENGTLTSESQVKSRFDELMQ